MESTNRNYNTQDNQNQYGSSYNPYASETYTTNYTTNYTTGGGNSSPVVGMSAPKSNKGGFLKAIVVLVFIGALIAPCILSPIINYVAFDGILSESDDGEYAYEYQYTTDYNDYYDDDDDYYDDWYDDWYNDDDEVDDLLPYSDVYKGLVEEAFGKSYEMVTPEEYASVTYIHAYYNDEIIEYAINDGEIKTFTYADDIYDYLDKDIKCFTGLKVLNVERASFYNEDSLEGLTQLKEVWSGNTAGELANLIENPENVEILGVCDSFYSGDLSGIEEFVNVTKLHISSGSIKNLDGLESLTKLKDLTILDGDYISNFTALSKLTTVERLYIASDKLQDLAVIKNMTSLKELYVSSSELEDISVLSNFKDTLVKLDLENMYGIDDYSVVDELVNLEELSLYCSYDVVLPKFTNMNKLKSIYLYGADDLSFLANATNLEEIDLQWCDFNDSFPFSNLKSVKSLTIKSPYSFPDDMSGVAALTTLEKLDITSMFMFGNAEAMFSLPNLKVLIAKNADFGIDMSKMVSSPTIEVLDLDGAYISKYKFVDQEYYDYYKEEEVDSQYIIDFLSMFPNVKELYIDGFELGDISFAEKMTKLEQLNISDNDVTRLEPLANLTNLQFVWCEGNSIIDADCLSEKVQLIFEEKY